MLNLFYIEFIGGPDMLMGTNPAYVDHMSLAKQTDQHGYITVTKNKY